MGWGTNVIDSIGDKIDEALSDTGKWCASVLDKGTIIYNRFISVAYDAVTKPIDDSDFSSFWTVINNLNRVMVTISCTIMVFLFLYNLITDALEVSKEVNLWGVVKQLVKLIVCNFIVANSLTIVRSILKFGTTLALLVTGTLSSMDVDIYSEQGLSDELTNSFVRRVHGVSGLLVTIIALLAAVVMMGSAITIILEVYKRFFKIFVLIPFASLSFSSFVMGDGNRGNEIFRGYLKNMLVVSFESIVIVLCMAFCSILTKDDGGFMNSLFTTEDIDALSATINSQDEMLDFNNFFHNEAIRNNYSNSSDEAAVKSYFQTPNNIYAMCSPEYEYYSIIGDYDVDAFHKSYNDSSSSTSSDTSSDTSSSLSSTSGLTSMITKLATIQNAAYNSYKYPVTVEAYKELSLGGALLLVLSAVLPMILCAAAVKEAPMLASKAIGS